MGYGTSKKMAAKGGKKRRPPGGRAGENNAVAHISEVTLRELAPVARRQPRQARARQTVESIVQAAAEVIAKDGWLAVTTNRVAMRAGVSIGSLYQYFPDKESILVAVVEQHMSEVVPIVNEALDALEDDTVPIEQTVRVLLERLVEMHARRPRLSREIIEQIALPAVAGKIHEQGEQAVAQRLASILRKRRDTRSDHALVTAYILGQTIETLSRWLVHEAPDSVDKKQYVRQVARMIGRFVEREG